MNQKNMSFTINDKLSFTDSFPFISSSLDSLVKNSSKDNFKYLSRKSVYYLRQVFDSRFYPY